MRHRACSAFAVSVLIAALAASSPVAAEEAGALRDEPYPVELSVGETFRVCDSGEVVCPAISPICDDLKVAEPVDTRDGLGFRGRVPGTTLCSAASTAGIRRVFRIVVR
ncbi:MAG TPA: hypothetical protein VE080_02100 [Candidatus Aquicultoraceae bacterium]|nr:hypothetical protein [Candidatus Aquicultoraceae bacterium]